MIIKAFACLFLLIVFPLFFGGLWLGLTGEEEGGDVFRAFAFSLLSGSISLWALFQLLSVPLIFANARFTTLLFIFSAAAVILLLLGMFLQKRILTFLPRRAHSFDAREKLYYLSGMKKNMPASEKLFSVLVLCGIAALFAFQVYHYVVLHHVDDDDSRFIVTALEAYEHNQMLHMNPATGEVLTVITDDEAKDMCSPWMMYVAFLSKMVRLHPAILAHGIYAVVLVFLSCLVYYLLGDELFSRVPIKRNLFLFLSMLTLSCLGGLYAVGTFTLTRIWQGKAVLAAIGIPFLFYAYLLLTRHGLRSRPHIFLFFAGTLALTLLSGMGVIFSGVLAGVFGVCLLIHQKSLRGFYLLFLFVMPALIYGTLYLSIY